MHKNSTLYDPLLSKILQSLWLIILIIVTLQDLFLFFLQLLVKIRYKIYDK